MWLSIERKMTQQRLTMHNPKNHITFTENIGNIEMIGMSATMDDSIHVQIQVVKLRKQSLIGNDLVDFWIALTEPAVKLQCY